MEITQDRNGRTIGLPLPESPAARAGIARGSELRSIDGVRVDGKSLFNVAALARGKPGTEVRVAIATRDGREREFSITRGPLTLPSVSMRTVEGSPVIVLLHFTRDTKADADWMPSRTGRGTFRSSSICGEWWGRSSCRHRLGYAVSRRRQAGGVRPDEEGHEDVRRQGRGGGSGHSGLRLAGRRERPVRRRCSWRL